MRQDHRFRKKKGLSKDQKRMLTMAAIPVIVIVLMAIIVIADHGGGNHDVSGQDPSAAVSAERETGEGQENPSENGEASAGRSAGEGEDPAAGETSGESGESDSPAGGTEPDESETEPQEEVQFADPFETSELRKDSVPELLDLMQQYFHARAVADAETMNRLYGISDVPAGTLEEQKALMRSNAKYVSGFKNIATYVMDGAAADTWLVYTLADITFYSAKNAAPMIMWCYVQKDAEGTYTIVDNSQLPANAAALIERANHSEAVRRLAADVNGRLKTVLEENEDLSTVYGVLREGSPVWQQEDETEPAVVVLGEESESAESEAETGEPEAGEEGTSEPETGDLSSAADESGQSGQ